MDLHLGKQQVLLSFGMGNKHFCNCEFFMQSEALEQVAQRDRGSQLQTFKVSLDQALSNLIELKVFLFIAGELK